MIYLSFSYIFHFLNSIFVPKFYVKISLDKQTAKTFWCTTLLQSSAKIKISYFSALQFHFFHSIFCLFCISHICYTGWIDFVIVALLIRSINFVISWTIFTFNFCMSQSFCSMEIEVIHNSIKVFCNRLFRNPMNEYTCFWFSKLIKFFKLTIQWNRPSGTDS